MFLTASGRWRFRKRTRQRLQVDPGFSVGALVLAAALGAVSAWLVTWIPRLAVAGLTIVLGVSYLLALLVPMYAWPSWITRLSLFGAIGHPYLAVPPWGGPLFLVTQAVAGFVLAATTATRATM